MQQKLLTPIPVLCRQRFEPELPLQQVFQEAFLKLPEFDFYQTGGQLGFSRTPVITPFVTPYGIVGRDSYLKEYCHYEQYRAMLYDRGNNKTTILFDIKKRFISTRDKAKQYEHTVVMEALADHSASAVAFFLIVFQSYPYFKMHPVIVLLHAITHKSVFVENVNHWLILRSGKPCCSFCFVQGVPCRVKVYGYCPGMSAPPVFAAPH